MDFSKIGDFFSHFQTERVLETLKSLNLGDLMTNPWFLGAAGLLAVISLIMRWRMLLATVVCSVGFTWLLSYTLARGTSLEEGSNEALLIFIGGGVVLVGLVIYLIFIRTE